MPRKFIWNWRDNVDGIGPKFNDKLRIESATYATLLNFFPTLGDLPKHLQFSGLESLVITFYNGGGGEIKQIPGSKGRLTCWRGWDVRAWRFLNNANHYVDKVSGNLEK